MSASEPSCLPVQPVSELDPRAVEWLWPCRMARGRLALLEGDPGLGKSLVALDLAARLSTGRPWPDGTPSPGPLPSLVIAGEDNNRDTLRPRLQALGADLSRVFCSAGNDPLAGPALCLPSQARALDRAIAHTGAGLVVLDPLAEFLDRGVSTNNEAGARRLLSPLAGIAEARRCVILMIRHLTKEESRRALYRGGGQIALIAFCRSAWLVAADLSAGDATDPGRPARRVMAQQKNNLAPWQPSLGFELAGGEGGVTALNWLGVVEGTAESLLERPRPARGPKPGERARAFLREVLAGGPLTAQEVWQRVRDEGLSVKTVKLAKGELEVRSAWGSVNGRPTSFWLLPEQRLPAGASPNPGATALEQLLEPVLDQFPERNPLEDDS